MLSASGWFAFDWNATCCDEPMVDPGFPNLWEVDENLLFGKIYLLIN